MRALVVEDYAPVRAAVREGLVDHGFAVDVAADGAEGLWLATSNPYDVVILDVMLPKLDGLELLRKLRATGSRSAVLLLTARDAVDDRVKGLDLGADDYRLVRRAGEQRTYFSASGARMRHARPGTSDSGFRYVDA